MQVKTFVFNEIRENTYVLWDDSHECIFVDAGCHSVREQERLAAFIDQQKLKPVGVYSTHGHFDHVMGSAFVCRRYNIKNYAHPDDFGHIEHAVEHARHFGCEVETLPAPHIIGSEIKFGNTVLQVLLTPGHSRGSVSFYAAGDGILFSGDTLFAGSVGRTDFEDSDYNKLVDSLRMLMTLPNETQVLAGHGYATDIGSERTTNPFLQ
ncbi:MBL fold hydrolase [Bacteroidia bacterium]|nr:MBL fold hydrolase [Bacteroidia bacterium]